MRAEEIRELSDAEMKARLAELQEERFRLRFRAATETLEGPLRVRAIRRDVARIKTLLRERELGKPAATKASRKAAGTGDKSARKARARGGAKS